jgi:hypothetical protein
MSTMRNPLQKEAIADAQLTTSKRVDVDPALLMDTLSLFTGEKSGHMARHGFRSPKFEGDKSAGLVYWAENVKNPDFPANLESKLITDPMVIQQIMRPIINESRHVSFIEIGCGL